MQEKIGKKTVQGNAQQAAYESSLRLLRELEKEQRAQIAQLGRRVRQLDEELEQTAQTNELLWAVIGYLARECGGGMNLNLRDVKDHSRRYGVSAQAGRNIGGDMLMQIHIFPKGE